MSRSYDALAFTRSVVEAQIQNGSRAAVHRVEQRGGEDGASPEGARDPLTELEQEFIGERDGFYLATVSETGWPYVQFRGGPIGFVTSPDPHTVAWADFRGNRQYITVGHLGVDERVAMFFMDYARRLRLKLFGRARVVGLGAAPGHEFEHESERESERESELAVPGYRAKVEREIRVDVTAYDWNCSQHITPRWSAEELAPALEPLHERIEDLQAENRRLRRTIDERRSTAAATAPEQDPGQ